MNKIKIITVFIIGFLSCLFTLFILSITYTWNIDYKNRAQVSNSINSLSDIKESIAEKILNQENLDLGVLESKKPENINFLYISTKGDIIFMPETGQLLWLTPRVENDYVAWLCLGGSLRDMPVDCQDISSR